MKQNSVSKKLTLTTAIQAMYISHINHAATCRLARDQDKPEFVVLLQNYNIYTNSPFLLNSCYFKHKHRHISCICPSLLLVFYYIHVWDKNCDK